MPGKRTFQTLPFIAIPLVAALSMGAPSPAAKDPAPSATEKSKRDSLNTLKNILEKEFKTSERIFRVKKKKHADSLLDSAHTLTPPKLRLLTEDTARTQEILTREGFHDYWAKVEKEYGISAMKKQYEARDPDHSRIPKIYLADSSIVILPGWIVLRKR